MIKDLIEDIDRWFDEGRKVALATVVRTWGSSPRPAGSLMAITDDSRISGSVSGGCVEAEVIRTSLEVLEHDTMTLKQFHASTERAHDVGLSCGGEITVCIRTLDKGVYHVLRKLARNDEEGVSALILESGDIDLNGKELVLEGDDITGSIPDEHVAELERILRDRHRSVLTGEIECNFGRVFFQRIIPRPQIISIGATHVAIALMQMAHILGYRTCVIDPRGVFATEERFSFVDELLHAWPQKVFETKKITSSTAICALTHDPKIDEPALEIAAASSAFYIGSLGRSTTQAQRCDALIERGVLEDDIARIFGPIGLDIGGKDPAAIALSILSEIQAVRYGRTIPTRTMLQTTRELRHKNECYQEPTFRQLAV